MSYHPTFQLARDDALFESMGPNCFCCGQHIEGPTFTYDAHPVNDGYIRSVHMHRDCAFAMAQRVIVDVWTHRRDGEPMQVIAVP